MSNIVKVLLAGLAATLVLSALMVMKTMVGVMPELDLPKMIAGMMGSSGTPMLDWAVHSVIGIVGYGLAIAFLNARLPSPIPIFHGVIIAMVGWLVMMAIMMPMVGAGLFGMNMGLMAPMMTLVLHLVFGAVLGWVYGKLLSNASGAGFAHA